MNSSAPAVFDPLLSDVDLANGALSMQQAGKLFDLFKQHPLFNWHRAHNGCEGRADAVCVLLDEWKIPNYKAWIFSGFYLKRNIGQLKNYWNYHVAPVLPVEKEGRVLYYVLDPATASSIVTVDEWATAITSFPQTYYGIRQAHWYIFPAKKIGTRKWHTRNKRNRKWMIECLAGINGLTKTGKAKLIFNKKQIPDTSESFELAKKAIPFLD